MMKWIKGLLALSVAIGVGMTWNFVWSKNSHNKQTVTPTTSIQADADEKTRSFTLLPVDAGNGNELIVKNEGLLTITSNSFKVGTQTTYGDLLNQLAKNEDMPVNYLEALKYFSLRNNYAGGNQLWGGELDTWTKQNFGNKTLSVGQSILNSEKTTNKHYSLDVDAFEQNLSKRVLGSEQDSKIYVPFRQSDSKINIFLKDVESGNVSSVAMSTWGMKNEKLDLKNSRIRTSADGVLRYMGKAYTPDRESIRFTGDHEQDETINFYRTKIVRIQFVDEDTGKAVSAEQTIEGYEDLIKKVKLPVVSGYKTDKEYLNIHFENYETQAEGGNSEPITVVYKRYTATSGMDDKGDENTVKVPTLTPKPITPFKVYGKQKLYRYSHANFTNKRRVQAHAKKVKAHAPVFRVVGTTSSSNGAARYKLSDGTHITASSKYVGKLYWNSAYKKLYVTNPKGINTYKSTALGQKVVHVKQGTPLTVKRMAKHNGMTRYQLASGQYISGSKKLVSPTKPKQVKRVKAKTTVRIYKDVNLKKVVKTVKKGSVITVKGWDYSHGNVHHVSGYKRYKVAGGYITANSKYVKIAQ